MPEKLRDGPGHGRFGAGRRSPQRSGGVRLRGRRHRAGKGEVLPRRSSWAERSAELRGRIEQNLGILATVQGALAAPWPTTGAPWTPTRPRRRARLRDRLSQPGHDQRRPRAVGRGRQLLPPRLESAEATGDIHLQGLCLLNHTEVHLARQRYDLARADRGARARHLRPARVAPRQGRRLPDARRGVPGHRPASSRPSPACSARRTGGRAPARCSARRRPTASWRLLYQQLGRNQDALQLLNAAAPAVPAARRPDRAGGRRAQDRRAGGDLPSRRPRVGPIARVSGQLHLRPLRAGGRLRAWRWPARSASTRAS